MREPRRSRTPRNTREPRERTPRRDWSDRTRALAESRVPIATWFLIVGAGLAALVCAMVPTGPEWLGGAGSVAVVSAYSWALAARTGGRPVVFGSLAVALGVAVLVLDRDELSTGAAVMTCTVAAVLAVMATVPAVTFLRAARECVVAVLIAGVGALATIGFEPTITVTRFEYVTFGLALVSAFAVVYRLGAGLHGLGRRGVVIVIVGGVVLRRHAAVRRAAASLRHARARHVAARRRRLEPREPRRLPAADRVGARHPGARLRLPHAGPTPAGLVGVRVRRRGDLGGRQLAGQPRHRALRERAVGRSTDWSSAWSSGTS